MPREILANNDSAINARAKINNNFEEVYSDLINGLTYLGILDNGDTLKTSPDTGDYYIANYAKTYSGGGKSVAVLKYDAAFYNGSAWEVLDGAYIRGYKEAISYSSGTVAPVGETDPLEITTVTHTFVRTYTTAPYVFVISKVDWLIYISSVSATQVVVGVGSSGGASTLDYDLIVI